MSCEYHVYCRTCGEEHELPGSNHQPEIARHLIEHRAAIAALVPYFEQSTGDAQLEASCRARVDVRWIARHQHHELVVRDEYQRILNTCGARIPCPSCQHSTYCSLTPGHDPPHLPERRPPRQ